MKKYGILWSKLILWVFAPSKTFWPLLLKKFLNNLISFQFFLMKIYLHYTYHTRKCYVKFHLHIFTRHEEMLGLITDTLSLKQTVSAIICEKNKT